MTADAVRAPLHRGGRRVAGAGAALQRDACTPASTCRVDAVARLAAHPNIVGMKESGSDLAQIADYVARTPDDFTVLAGSATTYFHALCAGCDGGILALASLFPDECVRLQALVREQPDRRGARAAAAADADRAHRSAAAYGVPGLKAALDLLGYAGGPPRPPLRPAPAAGDRDPALAARGARRAAAGSLTPSRLPNRGFRSDATSVYRTHSARARPEPHRSARDARHGRARAQPSRSGFRAAARRRAPVARAGCSRPTSRR